MSASVDPVSLRLGYSLGLGFLVLGIALLSGTAALTHAGRRHYSAAMIYLAVGAAAGAVVRGFGVGRLADPIHDHTVLEFVTDGALALALFATGMRIRRRPTAAGWHPSLRLVGLGLPAMAALVALWGGTLMGLGTGAAIALGAALAPTDPVLAGDLGVEPPALEEEEASPEPEFALTTEAGMNDGVGLPLLLLGIAVARGDSLWSWAWTQLLFGVGVAAVLGAATGRALAVAASELRERELLSREYDRWIGLAAAFVVFGAVEAVGAVGFVGAFAGGVAFRRHELSADYRREVHDGTSTLTHFGELTVMLILGSSLVLGGFRSAGGWGLALAPASVFVLRPLTAYLSLAGSSRLTRPEKLWVAWFGVRGVASLNFAAVAAATGAFGAGDRGAVVWTILAAVAFSIVVHGATSTYLTDRLRG